MAPRLGWVCLLVTLSCVKIGQSQSNGLGTPCQYDNMCLIPNTYCQPRSRTCECKSGHTHSNDRQSCIKLPERAVIGDPCVNPVDCAFTAEASRCVDNVCRRCSEGSEKEFAECTETLGGCAYHEYDGNCFRYRKLGEPCEVSEDCWIYPKSNKTRRCSESICQCEVGYNAMSGPLPAGQQDQCLKISSGNAVGFMISMVLFLASLLVTVLN